jgi:hypothetical protein
MMSRCWRPPGLLKCDASTRDRELTFSHRPYHYYVPHIKSSCFPSPTQSSKIFVESYVCVLVDNSLYMFKVLGRGRSNSNIRHVYVSRYQD